MKIAIIGLPQSGKTTVFNAASGKDETVGDYSKASHRAIIKVPDHRLDFLSEIIQPKKQTNAEIDYLDVCAFTGKGKNSDVSSLDIPQDVKYSDSLIVTINCFAPDCTPEKNFNLFLEELMLNDQIIIERNIEKLERTAKLTGDKDALQLVEVLKKCLTSIENEKPLSLLDLDKTEEKLIRGFTFLSRKPLLVVLNLSEDDINQESRWLEIFQAHVIPGVREFVALCGKIEMELAALDSEDRQGFLDELGIKKSAMEVLINKSYELLGLISFFTIGDTDVHAWPIKNNTVARKAAGEVHSDIERGFIRAEVMSYDDFAELKSEAAVKEAGKFRVEGKEYLVKDGDLINFRFNI